MPDIHFLRPLWFLALLPLPWVLWRMAAGNAAAQAWRDLVDPHLLSQLLVPEDSRARRLPPLLFALGWLLAVTSLAGPVWQRLPQPLFQAQDHRVIVLDLSPDMDAQDLSPSRLARARFEVQDLLAAASEGQTALLAFGAEPFVVAPLTRDAATIAAQVPDLDTALLPTPGPKHTDLALELAGEMLRRSGHAGGDIILLSADPQPVEAVRSQVIKLHDQGYRTLILGLGTEKGAPIPLKDGGFVTDDRGAIRLSRLQPDLLQDLASAGGGRYVGLSADDRDTRALLPQAGTNLIAPELDKASQSDQWREEGPWLLLAVLPLAALAFRRGWLSPLLLVILFLPQPQVQALGWDDLWWRADQQGARALVAGDPRQAAGRFSRQDWRAAAEYESGDYAQALETLRDMSGAEAAYNRGNALARSGKLPEAIAEYDKALAEVPDHSDAQHNRDLLQRLLDQQQSQSQAARSKDRDQNQNQNQIQGQGQGQEPSPRGHEETKDQQRESQPGQGDQQKRPGQTRQRADDQKGQEQRGDQRPQPEEEAGQKATPSRSQGDAGQPEGSEQPQPQQPQQQQSPKEHQREGGDDQRHGQSPEQGHPGEGQDVAPGQRRKSANPDQPDPDADTQDNPSPQESTSPDQRAEPSSRPGSQPGREDLIGDQPRHDQPQGPSPAKTSAPSESQQAMEYQLRRVPDDPGGLLRQRFLLQHLRRQGQLPPGH